MVASSLPQTSNEIVAIDGPAGSGKSTVARRVAEKLGLLYLDSGAIYRAVTLSFLRSAVNMDDDGEARRALQDDSIRVEARAGRLVVFLDGVDVSQEIRSERVTRFVSAASELSSVRDFVNSKLRSIAKTNGGVLDGRDIGTVVFPQAKLKIYMSASLDERARRRHSELQGDGIEVSLGDIRSDIARRDKHDSERRLAPLKQADDAIVLDTTDLSIDGGVEFIINEYHSVLTQ